MTLIDITLILALLVFLFSGYRSGFIKKVIGIACLILALVLGTKFSADLGKEIFEPIGIKGKASFAFSFIIIVVGVTLSQAIVYKILIKDMIRGKWNNVLGVVVGFFEGVLIISISLIVMSIYLNLPSEETKGESILYKPLKNAAPMVFDQINTFLPESEDFYQKLLNNATRELKKLEKR